MLPVVLCAINLSEFHSMTSPKWAFVIRTSSCLAIVRVSTVVRWSSVLIFIIGASVVFAGIIRAASETAIHGVSSLVIKRSSSAEIIEGSLSHAVIK